MLYFTFLIGVNIESVKIVPIGAFQFYFLRLEHNLYLFLMQVQLRETFLSILQITRSGLRTSKSGDRIFENLQQ